MNKKEYIQKLETLQLDKKRYCIISGGVMLLYGLKDTTEDIDIKIKPDYFEELKTRFHFTKSSKYPYLYELEDKCEVAVLDYKKSDIKIKTNFFLKKLILMITIQNSILIREKII